MKGGMLLFILVIIPTIQTHLIREETSPWQVAGWPGAGRTYERVPLIEAKNHARKAERRIGDTRHFDWFDEDDKGSSEDSDKGVMSTFFDEDSDDPKTKEDALRNRRRRYTRVHKMFLPLLIAYKLKYFTMVPLLLGALVLLVYTTGIAGFFFALFAAATGLHVKASHH